MKKLCTVFCSIVLIAAFAGVAPAADRKVLKAPGKKQSTAPKVPHTKTTGSKATGQNTNSESTKGSDSNKGKKVEKKEEPKKGDNKK